MHQRPAKTYPDGVFQKKSDDESQDLKKHPTFRTMAKDAITRAELYVRSLPDGTSTSLVITGPATGTSSGHMTFDSIGRIKLITGERVDGSSVSGQLQMRTYGQLQQHLERTDIEYNCGVDEDEEALNIVAYGQVIENCIGHQRTIRGTKIYIKADDTLIIEGQNIKLQAEGKITQAASSFEKVVVNDKETIVGQKMSFGAGEDTTMQFDPRASVNIISAGNINHKVLGDYKLTSLGCTSLFALGGAGTLVKNRSVGMSISTRTKFASGGTGGALLISSGVTEVEGTASLDLIGTGNASLLSNGTLEIDGEAKVDISSSGNIDVKGTKTVVEGTASVDVKGAKAVVEGTASAEVKSSGPVKITGATIFLN